LIKSVNPDGDPNDDDFEDVCADKLRKEFLEAILLSLSLSLSLSVSLSLTPPPSSPSLELNKYAELRSRILLRGICSYFGQRIFCFFWLRVLSAFSGCDLKIACQSKITNMTSFREFDITIIGNNIINFAIIQLACLKQNQFQYYLIHSFAVRPKQKAKNIFTLFIIRQLWI
jgi:hypothetical protein